MEDLNKLYKDLNHFDPHVRQNAVIGLGRYFEDENSRKFLTDEEKSNILAKLISRLEPQETSIEVKGRTVKILSKIAKFSKEVEIVQIFSKVINYITEKDAVGKDIYVTCMKSILSQAPGSCCDMIGKAIVPELTKGIMKSENKEIIDLCLDAFTDYINAFDYILINENESVISNKIKLIQSGINHISSDNESLQKNAIKFVGAFSMLLSKSQIGNTLNYLIDSLNKAKTNNLLMSYFNTLEAMARVSALKHVDYLNKIIPLTMKYANIQFANNDSIDYDEKNDLIESALNLQETYLIKVADYFLNSLEKIIESSNDLLEYDPNYSYDNVVEEENYDDGYDDYDYDQVAVMDDSSWKVRKAAVNVLHAVVKSGINIDKSLKEKIIQLLVKCLREHDENTKFDIIECLGAFLSSLYVINEEKGNSLKIKKMSSMVNDVLPNIINELMETVEKNLKSNNSNLVIKTLELLPNIATIGGNEVIGHFSSLKASFESACFKDNQNAILFYKFLSQLFISNTNEEEYEDILIDLMGFLNKGVTNDFYQVSIEALNSIYNLIPILATNLEGNKKYIIDIFNMTFPKFSSSDVDSGLKIVLIKVFGQIVISAGSVLNIKSIEELFKVFLEKTKNEALRPEIFSWIIKIVKESKNLNLENSLKLYQKLLIELLSQTVPIHIKVQALTLLENIFKKYPKALAGAENNIANTIQNLKVDDTLIVIIFSVYNSMINFLNEKSLENIIKQICSKINEITLTGSQLEPLFNFIQIAGSKVKPANLKTIFKDVKNGISDLSENKSKIIALLAGVCKEDSSLIDYCLQEIYQQKSTQVIKKASTFIGNLCLFSKQSHFDLISKLETLIQKADDELKNTLAISIGKIGLNDLNTFTKKTIQSQPNKLKMISVREFVKQISDNDKKLSEEDNNALFNWLTSNISKSDREFNDLCCECLGILAGYNSKLLPEYLKGFKGNEIQQSSYYYGLKFIFKKKFNLNKKDTETLMSVLISGLTSKELKIKEQAFKSLVSAAHNYSDVVKHYYEQLLAIFEESHSVKKEWIEAVDFGGGCKIITDKGIEIRNAVYNTTKIFIDNFPTKINIASTIKMCIDGVTDNTDIQSAVFACLIKIAQLKVSAFIAFADNLFDILKGYLDKLKNNEAKIDFCNKVSRLLEELKKEHDIAEGPKFVNLSGDIKKILVQ